MRERDKKVLVLVLVAIVCQISGPSYAKGRLFGKDVKKAGDRLAHAAKVAAPWVVGGVAVAVAGPAILLPAAAVLVVREVKRGVSDTIAQAYDKASALETQAAMILAAQEDNLSVITQRAIQQADSALQHRIQDVSELSTKGTLDINASVLRSLLLVERGVQRVLILVLASVLAAVLFTVLIRVWRDPTCSERWPYVLGMGALAALGALGFVAVVAGSLRFLGLPWRSTVWRNEIQRNEAAYAGAMRSLAFDKAESAAQALESYDRANLTYMANEKKAVLLREVFRTWGSAPTAEEGTDVLRSIGVIASLAGVGAESTYGATEMDIAFDNGKEGLNSANGMDPDLLTVMAYVSAANARERKGDALAAISARLALSAAQTGLPAYMNQPVVLKPIAELILQDYCKMPIPRASTKDISNELGLSIGEVDVCDPVLQESSDPEEATAFKTLFTGSAESMALIQQTSAAYTKFLDEWTRCQLPEGDCLGPRTIIQRSTFAAKLSQELQNKLLTPWRNSFDKLVVQALEPRRATRFARLDDAIYVRAGQYKRCLDLVAGKTGDGPAPPITCADDKIMKAEPTDLIVYRTATAAEDKKVVVLGAGKSDRILEADKTSAKQTGLPVQENELDQNCKRDEVDGVSIHARWNACYVPGLGRDPTYSAATALEAAILVRLFDSLTALSTLEADYQKIVKAEEAKAVAGTPGNAEKLDKSEWENFFKNAAALNLVAGDDSAVKEPRCGKSSGGQSFACRVFYKLDGEKQSNPLLVNLPDWTDVQGKIEQSASLQML